MDPNLDGEKAPNNCFGLDKNNFEKSGSRCSTKIAGSKIYAFGLFLVTHFAIETIGLKNQASSIQ